MFDRTIKAGKLKRTKKKAPWGFLLFQTDFCFNTTDTFFKVLITVAAR